MKKITFAFFISLLCLKTSLQAQNFVGGNIGQYSGIFGVLENPALAKDDSYKLDVNLFAVSGFLGNDYVAIDFSDWNSFRDGFNFDTDLSRNPNPRNKFFGNGDVLGPSVLFQLNSTSGLAISSRFRTFFNIYNLDGEIYDLASSVDINSDFGVTLEQLSGTGHGWGEVGLSYARTLINSNQLELNAGVTLKYLIGGGGVFGYSQRLQANYASSNKALTTSGSLDYAYTEGFENDSFSLSSGSSGLGADLGISFKIPSSDQSLSSYKLKGGISITDLGKVSYDNSTFFDYDLNATINSDEFRNKTLDEVLADNYPGSESRRNLDFQLPTAFRAFVDLPITSGLFVSLQTAVSLREFGENPSSSLINFITLNPRFEKKWFSIYSPLSFRQHQSGPAWGLGFRAGPVMLGSGSILSNLLASNSYSTDLYVGLRIPIYSKQ